MKTLLAVVAMSVAVPCAYADSFTYSGHWPSGTGDETATDVIVPDGVTATISTDDDVASVARLTSISIGDGAVVKYTASTALTLSAALSGTGAFIGENSALLTIAADNSGLVSPGTFCFTNTDVIVSNRYGLGSVGTAMVTFHRGSGNHDLRFGGAGLVCDAPIQYASAASNNGGNIGPGSAGETLVFSNSFRIVGTNPVFYFRNRIRFSGGTFGIYNNNHIYSKKAADSEIVPEVWFDSGVRVRVNFWFASDCIYHLGWDSVEWVGRFMAYTGGAKAICESANVLNCVNIYRCWDKANYLDLNGSDQSIPNFCVPYVSYEAMVVTSAAPACVKITTTTTDKELLTNNVYFCGAAGYTQGAACTNTFRTTFSDTTGPLTVEKGGLRLTDGAGWGGTNVLVKSGATLELESSMAIPNGTATLTVEDGGKIVLRSGAACNVRDAIIGSTSLESCSAYTVSQLRDMGFEDLVDGDANARLTVCGDGEWHGWPAGGTALVPSGTTVYIGDADVPRVNGLYAIELMPGSMVVCTNWTTPLALTTPLSGSGKFVADGTAPIVLNGNNIGLQAPGTFCFTNTDVIVSNRYGLGSVGTAMVTFHRGSGNHDLRFGGAGLVCDAPIQYASAASNNGGNIGPDSAGETLIFSNSFRIVGAHPTFYFRNRIRFSGGTFGIYNSNHIYSKVAADSEIVPEVWFDSGVKVRVNYWFASGCIYHLGWDAVEWVNLFVAQAGGSKVICESANALKALSYSYGAYGNANYLDINGIDQSLCNFTEQYHLPDEAIVVTSAVPACVKVTNKATDVKLLTNSVCFCDAAGYTQGAACTNTFKTFFSDTTGPLTVEKGGLRLTDGAGWGGTNVLVKSGATLLVDSSSMSVAFGNKALQGHNSWTKLEIEAGGTLELATAEKPAMVRSLVYNGSFMPAGTYTSSSGVGIKGDGALYVRSSTDGEPGAMIIVY